MPPHDLHVPSCPRCGDPVTSGCYPANGICAVTDDTVWSAIATDESGYVLKEEQVAERCAFIVIGRDTAEPIDGQRMPETANTEDVFAELDLVGETPEQVDAIWQQQRELADDLNKLRVQHPEQVIVYAGPDGGRHTVKFTSLDTEVDWECSCNLIAGHPNATRQDAQDDVALVHQVQDGITLAPVMVGGEQ